MSDPLLNRIRAGFATPLPDLLADVFAFVAGIAGQDCDCDCVEHDEDGRHTSECAVCEWCEAEHLIERWEFDMQRNDDSVSGQPATDNERSTDEEPT